MLAMGGSLMLFLSIILVVPWLLYTHFKTRPNYPPGPKGLPIIGSLLEINNERPWITYGEWAAKYGESPDQDDNDSVGNASRFE